LGRRESEAEQAKRRGGRGRGKEFLFFFFSKIPKRFSNVFLNSLLSFETNHSIQNNMQQHVCTIM
jgi:hypothetical protein